MNQEQTPQSAEDDDRAWAEGLIQKYNLPIRKAPASSLEWLLLGYPRKILFAALVIIILMGVCPPWVSIFNARGIYSKQPIGYSLLFLPPSPLETSKAYGVSIDFGRLLLQWFLVVPVSGLGFLFVRWKKNIQPFERLVQHEIDRLILEKDKIRAEIEKAETDAKIARARYVDELSTKLSDLKQFTPQEKTNE